MCALLGQRGWQCHVLHGWLLQPQQPQKNNSAPTTTHVAMPSTATPLHQSGQAHKYLVSKCLELPATSHAVVVVAVVTAAVVVGVEVDTEALGGKTPNNEKVFQSTTIVFLRPTKTKNTLTKSTKIAMIRIIIRIRNALPHVLAARVDQWIIPKEPLPLTGIIHQNSGRCL